ncbi:Metal tolerance protein 3 [Lasiodiplodia theobromae]|uniref:Metal tolerance protein 3 n=1 Tax=Lasiodiplodia theobromae TaxID=45133 RepID=A0A5N5DB00_9PEZI|nr:Metal tolerance protein 3 [Lasiodiplodia theobromae]
MTEPSSFDLQNRSTHTPDVEASPPAGGDPLDLRSKIKEEQEMDQITANTSRRRKRYSIGKNSSQRASALRKFYEEQNANIRSFLKPIDNHQQEAADAQSSTQLKYKIAVYGSLAANVVLSALQLYGAVSSGSLSLFTTMADSVFDPLSGLMLLITHRTVKKVDAQRFPSGKARISTAGNIVFSFLMCAVSLILIVMSARDLAAGSDAETKDFYLPSVIAVAVAFCTKLALFFYCWALKDLYSQVHILWRDHRNDLLINGFGILTSVGGAKLKWYIDPTGAIVLSALIAFLWGRTIHEEFLLLIGVSADVKMQQLITYIAMTHSDLILQVDTVRAYYSGPRIIAEVDVVMDSHLRLDAAHDVAEELQMKLEQMPQIERAFVHIDYETNHSPEHSLKKYL